MKTKDELLYKNKTTLESKKSSLTILQNNMPSEYKTDTKGLKHINPDYTVFLIFKDFDESITSNPNETSKYYLLIEEINNYFNKNSKFPILSDY